MDDLAGFSISLLGYECSDLVLSLLVCRISAGLIDYFGQQFVCHYTKRSPARLSQSGGSSCYAWR